MALISNRSEVSSRDRAKAQAAPIAVQSYDMPDGYCGIFCYRDDTYSGTKSDGTPTSDGYGGTFADANTRLCE